MGRKDNLIALNSYKTKSINKFTIKLHDIVDNIYECLMDDDLEGFKSNKIALSRELSNFSSDYQ